MQNDNEDESYKRKLFIDTTFLFDQYSKRGIGRYGKEVVRRIIKIALEDNRLELHLAGFLTLDQNLINLNFSQFSLDQIRSKINFHSFGPVKPSGILNIVRWYRQYKPLLETIKPDLYFAAHFERGLPTAEILTFGLNHRPKVIVHCPDVIPLAIPNFKYSSKGFLQSLIKEIFYKLMWQGIKHADQIVTISDFSKKDIVKFGHISEDKIQTIYLGVDPFFYRENYNFAEGELNQILELYSVNDKRYFLFDAGLEANKGSRHLLKTFQKLLEYKNEELPSYLVITGGDFHKGIGSKIKAKSSLGEKFLARCKKLNILDRVIATGRISDEDLIAILSSAAAYINFSEYEGFSFGPVQAMAAEIPAIAANLSCIPEITDGGALLLDLNDLDKAASDIKDYLLDKEKVSQQLAKGKEIAKRYDWDITAEETYQLMLETLK